MWRRDDKAMNVGARSSTSSRRWRRIAVLLGAIVLLVAGAAIAAVAFRTDLVHAVIADRLARQGFNDARFAVERVGMREIVVADLSAGGSLAFDGLSVAYTPTELLKGQVGPVMLAGLRLDLTRPGPWDGSGGSGGSGVPLALGSLPAVELKDFAIKVPGKAGPVTVSGNASIRPRAEAGTAIRVEAAASGAPGTISADFKGTVEQTPDGGLSASGRLRAKSEKLVVEEGRVEALTLDAPMTMTKTEKGIRVSLEQGTRLDAGKAALEGGVQTGTMSGTLTGTLSATPTRHVTGAVMFALTSQALAAADTTARRVSATLPLRIEVRDGKARIDIGPDARLSASGLRTGRNAAPVSAAVTVAGKIDAAWAEAGKDVPAPTADIRLDPVRLEWPGWIDRPLSLTATLRRDGAAIAYDAAIGGLGIPKLAGVTGRHDPATGKGSAAIAVPDTALAALPSPLVPALKPLRRLAGMIGGDARLSWSGGTLKGQAALRLAKVGFETDSGAVEGISGTITLDQLFPPATAKTQHLRIAKVSAGAALKDITAAFALLPSGVLRIDRAAAGFADGKLIVEAPAIDLLELDGRATATLEGAQLAPILDLVDLKGVSATGTLNGQIPVRLKGDNFAIDGGRLVARGGGVLHVKSDRARQVLKSGGEKVGLMLQALEDFTYQTLSVEIDKSLTGETTVLLRTLGHNPAVLKGRKFQINVNLQTNLDRLLNAAIQWYRLSGRALRGIVGPAARQGKKEGNR